MDYQLVKEEKHHFTIRHPKGHEITVAKAGLDPKVISKIKAMPVLKMSDGGDVPDPAQAQYADSLKSAGSKVGNLLFGGFGMPTLENDPGTSPAQTPSPLDGGTSSMPPAPTPGPLAPPTDPTANLPAAPSQTPQIQSTPQPASPDMGMGDVMKTLTQDRMGVGSAGSKGIQDMQNAFANYQTQQAKDHADTEARYAAIDKELQANQDAVTNGKVDPNRLYSNMSTGNKVLAGISILLSGIGSGLSHQANGAMEVIQKNIDRDIEAQKASLGKQTTLFSMNMQRYRNAEQAEIATRAQLGANFQAQLGIAAAKTQNAQTMAQAKLMSDQLVLPYKVQLAKMQGEAPLSNGQGLSSVPGYVSSDKDLASRMVYDPVTKKYHAAFDSDGAKKLNGTLSAYVPVRNILTQLQQLGTTGKFGPDSAEAQSLRAQLVPALNELKDTKRISEEDVKLISQEADDPNNWGQIMSRGTRTKSMLKNVDDQVESMKKQYLPNYRGPQAANSFTPGLN